MSFRQSTMVMTRDAAGTAAQRIGPGIINYTRTAGVQANINGRVWEGARRSGQVAAGYAEVELGAAPGFHDLIDPTTPKRDRGFEVRDWVMTLISIGVCSYAWGFHDYSTVNDPTTLVGVGFEHGSDYIWKTFLRDMPGGVGNRIVHQTVLTQLGSAEHLLAIVFDSYKKTIYWYVDNVLVDTYTPLAPLDMTGGSALIIQPKFRYRGFVPANGDMTVYAFGGELTTPLLTIREFP